MGESQGGDTVTDDAKSFPPDDLGMGVPMMAAGEGSRRRCYTVDANQDRGCVPQESIPPPSPMMVDAGLDVPPPF